MLHEFSRTELLIGTDGLKKLSGSCVAVFGIGGVGSYAVEGLARCGIGKLVLIDDDCICLTNLNRQIHATKKTVGISKTEAMRDRVLEINPSADVRIIREFYLPANGASIISKDFDYIIDAVDTVTAKIDLIIRAQEMNIPIISCMGTANKLDPSKFEVTDIFKTSVCPLASVMRRELRKRTITSLKVVYSRETPIVPVEIADSNCASCCVCPPGTTRHCTTRRQIPGSISFVPPVAGMIAAGEVVRDILKIRERSDIEH